MNLVKEYRSTTVVLKNLQGELLLEEQNEREESSRAQSLRVQIGGLERTLKALVKEIVDDSDVRFDLFMEHRGGKVSDAIRLDLDQQLDGRIEAAVMRILSRTSNPHVTSDGYASDGWPGESQP